MNKKQKIKEELLKLKSTGFFSIFLATVLSKVITLLGGVILVRVLSKNDYGMYAYIHNCYSMLFILNDFGISCAALQYLTENINNKEKQAHILSYSIKSSLIISCVTCILIVFSPYFYPYTMETAKVITPILFLLPIITVLSNLLSVVLRANFENNKYAKLQIFTTIITYLVLIIFSIFLGLRGAILSEYIYRIIIFIYSIILTYAYIKKIRKNTTKNFLSKNEKKGFIKYAIAGQLNDSISSLLLHIDMFLIGYMIAEPKLIATYNVGSKLPYALTFLTTCISIYITPYFVKNNNNIDWIKKSFKKVIKYSILGFGIICTTLIIFSKLIFKIVFGKQYYDAIPIYIILIIGLFFVSSIKTPCANILSALRKLKINIITNFICIVINFISNIIFIKIFGIIGAAITTTITNILASFIYAIYLKVYIGKVEKMKMQQNA